MRSVGYETNYEHHVTAATIAVVNRKGGVGKTSTVFHLGGTYAAAGCRVLLVDNDPQHSLTSGLFGPRFPGNRSSRGTIVEAFRAYGPLNDLVTSTPFENLWLVPGNDVLDRINRAVRRSDAERLARLAMVLDAYREQFDVILIDNPPNLQFCTTAALIASDYALVVSQPEDYGSQGSVAARQLFDRVRGSFRPSLGYLGILLNMVNARLAVHRAYETALRETYGGDVLRTTVPQTTQFKEAVSARKPISHHRPRSAAAASFEMLAIELLDRMKASPETQRRETSQTVMAPA